ncbi:MAG: hypothetical protein L0Y75_02035 [Acidobacteria bacterium]|nr:hypothetical protein [Acidobacteriota bacterium]
MKPGSQNFVQTVIEKLTLWVVFNVLIALLPFLFRFIGSKFAGRPMDWKTILSDGELLLVASAVAAGAIGELVAKGKNIVILRVLVGGGCVICLTLSSLLYAFIKAQPVTSVPPDTSAIFSYSIGLFIRTFLAGTGCIILSEVK